MFGKNYVKFREKKLFEKPRCKGDVKGPMFNVIEEAKCDQNTEFGLPLIRPNDRFL
jgi:hypothetical protein